MVLFTKGIVTILLLTNSLTSATIQIDKNNFYFDDLQKVFDVDFTSDKPDSCKQWQHHLEVAYVEALHMLTAAIEAVAEIHEAPPDEDDPEAAETLSSWRKRAHVWRAM